MTGLTLPFIQIGVLTGIFAGLAIAWIGCFVALDRNAFSGLTAAQLAGLGTVAGAIMASHASFLWAWVFVFGGLILGEFLSSQRSFPRDGVVAGLYVVAAAAAVLILSKSPGGEAGTMTILFGNILGLTKIDLYESVAALAIVFFFLFPVIYKFVWLSFSKEAATASGIKENVWRFLFQALLAMGLTLGIHLFGVLLAFSFLVFPTLIGLGFFKRTASLFYFIPVLILAVVFSGFILSFNLDLPTGPTISAILGALALSSAFLKKIKS